MGELDVVCRHLLAGVEQHAVAEVERVRQLVLREVVARGQPGLDVLAVGGDRVERLHELLEDPDGLVVEDGRRVHAGRVLRARDHEVAAAGRAWPCRACCAPRRSSRCSAPRGHARPRARKARRDGCVGSWGVPPWQRRRSREYGRPAAGFDQVPRLRRMALAGALRSRRSRAVRELPERIASPSRSASPAESSPLVDELAEHLAQRRARPHGAERDLLGQARRVAGRLQRW